MTTPDFVEIPDGDWVAIRAEGLRHACCDCGLVHTMDFRMNAEGRLEIRARRVSKATAVRRRQLGVRVVGDVRKK
jgi:hypothetical protein